MNGRNRHLQYRRSVYRRRQIRLGLILTVIITVVLILGFLIVGNLLRKKNQPTENQGVTNPPPSVTEEEHSPILTLKARSVLLETADTSTFSSRVRALTENGTTALSIPLNNADGSLLYRSDVGSSLGYPTMGTPSVSISSALSQIKDETLHFSGVFYLTAFSEEDPLLRSVALSHSAAILAEAIDQGLNDILLIAPDMQSTHTDELLRFAESIRILSPKASIGLSLNRSLLTHEQASDLVDRLWNGMDYLALNAAEYGEEDPVSYAAQTVNDSSMMYTRLRYQMRVLLPSLSDTAQTDAVIAAVEGAGVQSWQIIS